MIENSGMRPPVLVGIGELLWDLLPTGKQLGGAPMNFAYHARALGADGVVVSSVGEDELGREILTRLDNLGMSRNYVGMDPAHPTGVVQVSVDAKGVPTFTIQENVAWDFITVTPALLDLAAHTDVVCFGSLAQRSPASRQAIEQFLAACPPYCLRIFDINLRQNYFSRKVIHESLLGTDVLKLNDQELPVLAKLLGLDTDEMGAVSGLMLAYPFQMIALTRGGAGSRLYVSGHYYDHPGCEAEVVDTVGAGDAFTAALAMGLRRGLTPDQINENANRLAAYVCSQAGATPIIPAELVEGMFG